MSNTLSVRSLLFGLAIIANPIISMASNCITASPGHGFVNQAFAVQSSQFTATFDATPSNTLTDEVIALSHGPQNAFNDFAVLVRFNRDGIIDARNGGFYNAVQGFSYHAGLTYHFTLNVDVMAHTYTIHVKQGTGSNKLIGTDFAFRLQQADVFSLDSLGAISNDDKDSLTVCNLSVVANADQVPNPDCTIIVPNSPLSATGLATPYQLVATDPHSGPCHEANADQSAFVQAAVIDPATGKISIYNPLVIDKGTQPAIKPVVPTLPANGIVAIWFGYNGNNLIQSGNQDSLESANCVNGSAKTVFGQFSYCNAVNFFKAANKAIAAHQLVIPPLGTAKDGRVCPTSRDFSVIDQDPSDNLTTTYLKTPGGQFAQNNAANVKALPTATVFANPSDERLVAVLLATALTCPPMMAPDLADAGKLVPALPLNELQAAAFQKAPVALVGLLDPMALNDGDPSLGKLNAYRRGVDQPVAMSFADVDPVLYCKNFRTIAPAKMQLDKALLLARPSPMADVANSLFTFLAQRFVASYGILDCENLLELPSPVSVTFDANGVAISATIQ